MTAKHCYVLVNLIQYIIPIPLVGVVVVARYGVVLVDLIQYVIPILEGGWLEAGLGSHVKWIRRSIL